MPYEVKGKCVYKKDGGAKVGCTKGDVNKYLAALHANVDENVLIGGKADNLSIEDIANKFNVSVADIQNQINKGIGIEMEHTNDKIKATEIATDHVSEIPDYYDRLIKMEHDAYKQMGNDAANSVDMVSSMNTSTGIYENTKTLIKRLVRENLNYSSPSV